MESSTEIAKIKATHPEKESIDPPKTASTLEIKNLSETQQSVLKKTVGSTSAKKLIKILPKSTIPLKTVQVPNGNIIVHGPHNKLLSLIKHPNITTSSTNASSSNSLSLMPISISKDTKSIVPKIPGLTLIATSKNSSKEPTNKVSTASSTISNTVVSSKTLEIKPITVTNSPKALTPAQAATVPIAISQLPSHISFSKVVSLKTDNNEKHSITIEKNPQAKQVRIVPVKKDLSKTKISAINAPPPGKMINLQISNGKLSDPNGPIKMLKNSTIKEKEPTTPSEKENEKDPLEIENCSPKEETTAQNSIIRVRSIESLQPTVNKLKPKQQSLLKNKALEKIQKSPRTKGRSKSLTLVTQRKDSVSRKSRRLSVASDSGLKAKDKNREPIKLSKTEPAMEVNTLLCPEKISESSDSLVSMHSTESVFPLDFVKSEIIDITATEDEPIIQQFGDTQITKIDNETCNVLKWANGVGTLKESKLQFQFNEFGLIELIDTKNPTKNVDICYEKPLFEREYKSQKTSDYSDPLYFCKGCHCQGAAIDFLAPEFCSHQCIQKFNTTNTKKYTNRKKCLFKFELPEKKSKNSDKIFSWDKYLSTCKGNPTPIALFLNPFPSGPNTFKIGMKLEAIDPEHSSLFCVCSIVDIKGYRLKIHFDGYSKFYDFWVNADSMDIFPPGWCAKTNRTLQPPKGLSALTFNWPMYLNRTNSIQAPRNIFTHLNSSSSSNPFKLGMKLEADDLRNTGKVCVASVADILDNRILIHFDGWDESYNYWIDISSPYIHPVNWHKKNGFSIVPPPEWQSHFSWKSYLAYTKCIPATEELFTTREPIGFKPGMKLEVVDKRNPTLIRPASVVMTDDYEIKVLFEGWPMEYAFWVEDDSPDIHPIGWCEFTEHELESPPDYKSLPKVGDCDFPGCRGIGNTKREEIDMHSTMAACPYEIHNWTKEFDRSGRLENKPIIDSEYETEIRRSKRKGEAIHTYLPAKIPKQQAGNVPLIVNSSNASTEDDSHLNISRHLLCDYGPRLQQVYTLWKANSECLTKNLTEQVKKNPLEWNISEVAEFISKLPKCQSVAHHFIKQEIDGAAFLSMRQRDLSEQMKIKLGPAIKIYNQIVQLREEYVTRFMNSVPTVS